jgi:L-fuconolactonase
MRLDAHQHFWRYDPGQYPWIGEGMSALKRDFLPADSSLESSPSGIRGCIAVQARQSLEETRFLLGLAENDPYVKGVLGWVDLCGGVEQQLDALGPREKLKGIRHIVQDEPDDRFMLRKEFLRGLEALQRQGLAYDFLVFPRQLPAAIEVARRFPGMRFVLDHLAKPTIKSRELSPWREQLAELAGFPNVSCKISGLVTEADWKGWAPADFQPYFEAALAGFGPLRLIFGSDWPVCLLAASYAQVAGLAEGFCARLSVKDREAVFGGNATRIYALNPGPDPL